MTVANDILIPELARLLREEKEVRFTPSGVSMRPFIEGDRDSVVLAPLNRSPRSGDIVLAHAESLCGTKTYVLHRIIRIEGEKIILQGDGNLDGVEWCGAGDIIGRVVRIENAKGKKKLLTRGRLWRCLSSLRPWLLKIYRHTWLKWEY